MFLLVAVNATAQTTVILVGKGNTVMLSGNVYVVHQGDIQNNGLINSDSSSTLVMNGSHILQQIGGSSYDSTRIGNIVQNDSGIGISTNVRIIKQDSFVSGFVRLNNNNWRLEKNAHYAGTDTVNKFFQTNGTGYLYKDNIGSTPYMYPIGTLAQPGSYTPFTLKNDSIIDNFGIRVADGQYASYDANGMGVGSPNSANRLQKTWVLNEDVPGGSKASLSLQWLSKQEGSGFIRDSSVLDMYNSGTQSFSFEYNTTISGDNPYTLSVANINNVVFANTPMSLMDLSVALPVELYTFNAVRISNDGYLTWITLSETNNSYFGIERSIDGYTYHTLGTVNGQGHSVTEHMYDYTDKNITTLDVNTIYYRLRQVNYDGTYTYSDVRVLRLDNNNADIIRVYPNPTTGNVHLNITTTEDKQVQVSINDPLGRLLYTNVTDLKAGKNDATVNMNTLPSGIYLLRVVSDAHQNVYRIFKTN